jgi:hypothetical protein
MFTHIYSHSNTYITQIVPNNEAVSALPERLAQGVGTANSPSLDLVFRVMLPPLGFTSVAIDRPGDPGK